MTPAEVEARLTRAGNAEAEARQWRIAAADAEQLARACDLRTLAPPPPDVAASLARARESYERHASEAEARAREALEARAQAVSDMNRAGLTEAEARALTLHYLEGYQWRAVAVGMHYSVDNIYCIRRRALAKLADHWGAASSPPAGAGEREPRENIGLNERPSGR